MKNSRSGVIHLLLLIVVFVAAIGLIIVVMVFKPNMDSVKQMTGVKTTEVSPTNSVSTDTNLEAEVNAENLSDPSIDFVEVDKDINSL